MRGTPSSRRWSGGDSLSIRCLRIEASAAPAPRRHGAQAPLYALRLRPFVGGPRQVQALEQQHRRDKCEHDKGEKQVAEETGEEFHGGLLCVLPAGVEKGIGHHDPVRTQAIDELWANPVALKWPSTVPSGATPVWRKPNISCMVMISPSMPVIS